MRIRGGTRGLLTGIEAGRLDEFDAYTPPEDNARYLSPTDSAKAQRRAKRRARRRAKRLAARLPF